MMIVIVIVTASQELMVSEHFCILHACVKLDILFLITEMFYGILDSWFL
jgi:hypothetical protein